MSTTPNTATAALYEAMRRIADAPQDYELDPGRGDSRAIIRTLLAEVESTAIHTDDEQPAAAAPFTEGRAAFMQIGTTPALQGLRAELRIEGYPPLVGRYAGAGMRRADGQEGLLLIEPTLVFEREQPEQPAPVEVGQRYTSRTDPNRTVTVTRVWQPPLQDGPAVAYDIWEPGYQGAPGSWGSACPLDVFHRTYRLTDSGPVTPAEEEETSKAYPCGIGVYCDECGIEVRGDYLVTDDMTSEQRLACARTDLSTRLGWSCTDAGDFCPACQYPQDDGQS